MERIKIAITANEPVLYTDLNPSLEECPALIIVDEYNRIQKYAPEITQKGSVRGKVDWIISRGAKILITGSMSDQNYQKLKKAKIAIDWVAFGTVKDLVQIARERASYFIGQLDKPIDRCRYEKNFRPRIENGLVIYSCGGNNSNYIDELEKKAKKQTKKSLLKSRDYEDEDY